MLVTPNHSRVLHVDLFTGKSDIILLEGRHQHIGGSGLAAALYQKYGFPEAPALDPRQPLIFAIGPLTGFFPLMSKVVCGFRSPYTGQWAESHAGGRLALALRFAGYDAVMITGKAKTLSALVFNSVTVQVHDVHFLAGKDVFATGRFMRRYGKGASGHRSTVRIGAAGENLVSYACTNVDSFRHFGRLGSGAALGAKHLKAMVVVGDNSYELPKQKEYTDLYAEVYKDLTETTMMRKYHNLGTPENLIPLNELKSLPWRNLQATSDPAVTDISGEYFAKHLLMRNAACSGCPVGCIHIGMLREQYDEDHKFTHKQVGYDYELIFAQGSMLGITNGHDVLHILDDTEKLGLDSMSTGVMLAWCTEAFEKGLVTEKETCVPLAFGDVINYCKAMQHLVDGTTDFWKAAQKGTEYLASQYKGEDFACSLGQEMAGYATGETFFVAQALGFRHSHLDTGAYSLDQTTKEKDCPKTVDFFIKDEAQRCELTSLISCLFARKAYSTERNQKALASLGMEQMAESLVEASGRIQATRWQLKLATGFDPHAVKIPKRFTEVVTWKGTIDTVYMAELQQAYANAIVAMKDAKGIDL